MGSEHPLAKSLVTPKVLVPDIMRVIILDKLKETFGTLESPENCEYLIKAIYSWPHTKRCAEDYYWKSQVWVILMSYLLYEKHLLAA